MSPPNTDIIIQEIQRLDLQSIAREKGPYIVFPKTKVKSILQSNLWQQFI